LGGDYERFVKKVFWDRDESVKLRIRDLCVNRLDAIFGHVLFTPSSRRRSALAIRVAESATEPGHR
jgi:hypothetical protein